MKLKDEVIIAPGNNEHILVDATGTFKGMIKLNESAYFIANLFTSDVTIEEAVKKLMEEYDVSLNDATDAVKQFVAKIQGVGLFE